MARTPMVTHPVHGSDANAITLVAADLATFDQANGMSLAVTGNQTIILYNPTGGAAITVTVPSAPDKQNRKNDTLISAISIATPGYLILPKFLAADWAQGAEGIHLDSSATGLKYLVLTDPTD